MNRTVLLKGEVPVRREELDRLRRRDAELTDYIAAIRSPRVQAVRQRAMAVRRNPRVNRFLHIWEWAQGVMDYEEALGQELLERMRGRD